MKKKNVSNYEILNVDKEKQKEKKFTTYTYIFITSTFCDDGICC